jgi:alpha-beta hydrolase superfamily lysophospholipase
MLTTSGDAGRVLTRSGQDAGMHTEIVGGRKAVSRRVTAPGADPCRLTRLTGTAGGTPAVLLSGMFDNRRMWLLTRSGGLAGVLADQGYDPWILERRGFGLPDAARGARRGLTEHVAEDIPLVQRIVAEETGRPAFWIGHSFGGVMIARALAMTLDAGQVKGAVLIAAQCEVNTGLLRGPGALAIAAMCRLGRFPSRTLGIGPEDEPPEAMADAVAWTRAAQTTGAPLRPMAAVRSPVLAVVGAADIVAPPRGCARLIGHFSSPDRTFLMAGRRQGYSRDYGHASVITHPLARQEVFPKITDWLDARNV